MAHGGGYQGFLRGLREADRVVVLAAHLASDYKEFCDPRRLAVIPHGVEVGFFTPAPDKPQQPLVLTVGNWLRDYDFWAEIVLRLADQNSRGGVRRRGVAAGCAGGARPG